MDAADAGVRAELGQLNVGALRARAQADGVDAALIEVARDGDDPKAELTDLIVRRFVTLSQALESVTKRGELGV
jgi:hypothetical protein